MNLPRWFYAEVLGTFLLVFFGCGSVATAVVFEAPAGLVQVALVWGLGLTLAIYLTGPTSGAHLNPAISIAFAVLTDFQTRRLPGYIGAQFAGAILAAALLYALFGGGIEAFEEKHGIIRGEPGSEASAMIFGEFYPNPGGEPLSAEKRELVGHGTAFLSEFAGTALLAMAIFGLTALPLRKGPRFLLPAAVGLTLTVLISIFAPLSMAGFNPARDLGPRLFSALAGWKSVPFSTNGGGWLTVFVIAPCLGAVTGGFLIRKLVVPGEKASR